MRTAASATCQCGSLDTWAVLLVGLEYSIGISSFLVIPPVETPICNSWGWCRVADFVHGIVSHPDPHEPHIRSPELNVFESMQSIMSICSFAGREDIRLP